MPVGLIKSFTLKKEQQGQSQHPAPSPLARGISHMWLWQPCLLPGPGTKQVLELLRSARAMCCWQQLWHSAGYHGSVSDEETHQESSQSHFVWQDALHHLSSFQLWKISKYLPFSIKVQGHYRIQVKVFPIWMTENQFFNLNSKAKPEEKNVYSETWQQSGNEIVSIPSMASYLQLYTSSTTVNKIHCYLTLRVAVALLSFSSSTEACWQSWRTHFYTGKKQWNNCAQNCAAPPWPSSVPVLHARLPAETVYWIQSLVLGISSIHSYHTWRTHTFHFTRHVYKKFIGRTK